MDYRLICQGTGIIFIGVASSLCFIKLITEDRLEASEKMKLNREILFFCVAGFCTLRLGN